MKITHVTLSGGGISGLSYIGCIRFLHMEGLTDDIRHVSGTSIGAFFATALALKIPYSKFETMMRKFCTSDHNFSTEQLLGIFATMGIDDGSFMVTVLREYIQEMTNGEDNDISFIELTKRTGVNLVVCTNRIETMTPFYFSVDSTPHVGVLEAVQASMSVPIFIRPKKIGDFHYSDGATNDNTPASCFSDAAPGSHIIFLLGSSANSPSVSPMTSLISLILAHFDTYLTNLIKRSKKLTPNTIDLDNCPIAFLPFKYHKDGITLTVTEEEFDKSLYYGYDTLQSWFSATTLRCSDNPS